MHLPFAAVLALSTMIRLVMTNRLAGKAKMVLLWEVLPLYFMMTGRLRYRPAHQGWRLAPAFQHRLQLCQRSPSPIPLRPAAWTAPCCGPASLPGTARSIPSGTTRGAAPELRPAEACMARRNASRPCRGTGSGTRTRAAAPSISASPSASLATGSRTRYVTSG